MRRLLEDVLDFIVHVLLFPYFIVRQFLADMRYLRSFKRPYRETLYDKISRNGGSFGEYMDNEHPYLSKAILYILGGALFAVAIFYGYCGPY